MLIVNYIVPHFHYDIPFHKKITTDFIYPTLQVTSLTQKLFKSKLFIVVATKTSDINYGSHQIWYHFRMPIECYICPYFHVDIPLNYEILQLVIYPVFQILAFSRLDFPQRTCIFWVSKAKKGCIASHNNWYFYKALIVLYIAFTVS